MRRTIVALIGICVWTSIATAEMAISGAGSQSCSEFGKYYKNDPAGAELFFFTWAQGYMSGINSVALRNNQPRHDLSASDVKAQQFHIRAYCDQHPLATYMAAVLDLYSSIPLTKY